MLSRLRALVKQADPEVVEEWKWRGVRPGPHAGLICTGESIRDREDDFRKGRLRWMTPRACSTQPRRQYRRAIDLREEDIDAQALK